MPEVVVPKMFTEWTTSRVLVMEWIEGDRLRSAGKQAPAAAAAGAAVSGAAAQVAVRQQLIQQQRSSSEQAAEDLRLVEIGVRCSLEQMLEEGYVLPLLLPTAAAHLNHKPSIMHECCKCQNMLHQCTLV